MTVVGGYDHIDTISQGGRVTMKATCYLFDGKIIVLSSSSGNVL